MENKRKSGVLVHISSLPSKYGIGDLGIPSKSFVDLLKDSSQKLWQILPIGPTEPFFDNSPYHSISAFAINPLFVSLEGLVEMGLISQDILSQFEVPESNFVHYEEVIEKKYKAFRVAFSNFKEDDEFYKFVEENKFFLEDYALFV
ncbi:MAG: 4-alpha-glucanotransferase, partial [Candidatus Aenigmatarchaeota archaeon]